MKVIILIVILVLLWLTFVIAVIKEQKFYEKACEHGFKLVGDHDTFIVVIEEEAK